MLLCSSALPEVGFIQNHSPFMFVVEYQNTKNQHFEHKSYEKKHLLLSGSVT